MNEERAPADPTEDVMHPPVEAQAATVHDASPTVDDGSTTLAHESDASDPEAIATQAEEALVDELEPIAEAAATADADEVDTAFGEHLDPETLAFGSPKPQAIVCQWCNGPLDSDGLEVCPHCGSRLKPTDEDLVVPGVTTLSAEAARALELVEIQRNRDAAKTGQAMYTTPSLATAEAVVPAPDEATMDAANRPPDEDVRRLMLEMELEARQARAMAAARSDIEAMIVADADHAAGEPAQNASDIGIQADAGETGAEPAAAQASAVPEPERSGAPAEAAATDADSKT